ncbi:fosfomycin resistance glutathione transferase [Collimonas silvisoli]|uniref:fosfomycin resistance glutathione transferase n=1 Tax=Collimonas silvisoli TaxID=2825884 RepID=UPI001B8AFF67|nr:fosfomycin resistance glutathione transferase [Collimonas silvisoli]
MLTGINHITLAVRDLATGIDFYQGLLGFRLAARGDAGAYLSLGELWLCLSLDETQTKNPQTDYTHYAFSISPSNFADFQEKLRAEGVAAWKDNKSEGDSFYFLDPDGHKLEAHVGDLATRLAQCRIRPYSGMKFFD